VDSGSTLLPRSTPLPPPSDAFAADEAGLVERCRGGEDAAFAALYRRSRRAVFAVCLHFLRDPAWAEDACHDAFVQAYERFATLRGEQFTPWVRRIAARQCLNLLRHRAVGRRLAAEAAGEAVGPSGHGAVAARQELELASALLGTLSPEQRRVFLLRHVEEMTYEEIAAATGYDAGRVRSYLQNARRNFRLRWEEAVARRAAAALRPAAEAHG
jgi:RNA polymerase sigma-70 factor (ECF subfamily)